MNGRAYDYNLGRFYGVDPFIQFPSNSQSLNPYSYLMNNPLSGTDPTGYMSRCLGSLCDDYERAGFLCELVCLSAASNAKDGKSNRNGEWNGARSGISAGDGYVRKFTELEGGKLRQQTWSIDGTYRDETLVPNLTSAPDTLISATNISTQFRDAYAHVVVPGGCKDRSCAPPPVEIPVRLDDSIERVMPETYLIPFARTATLLKMVEGATARIGAMAGRKAVTIKGPSTGWNEPEANFGSHLPNSRKALNSDLLEKKFTLH